jgi:DnaJ-class molecular chaperone
MRLIKSIAENLAHLLGKKEKIAENHSSPKYNIFKQAEVFEEEKQESPCPKCGGAGGTATGWHGNNPTWHDCDECGGTGYV